MRIGRYLIQAAVAAILLTSQVGCDPGSNSSFEGTYSGEMLLNSTLYTIYFDVNPVGNITNGEATQALRKGMPILGKGPTAAASSILITGNIANSGAANITVGNTEETFSGSFSSPTGATTISASMTDSKANPATTLYAVLIVNPTDPPASPANPFAGDYIGTDDDTTINETDPVAFTIDSNGNLSGFMVIPGPNGLQVAPIKGEVGDLLTANVSTLTATYNGSGLIAGPAPSSMSTTGQTIVLTLSNGQLGSNFAWAPSSGSKGDSDNNTLTAQRSS